MNPRSLSAAVGELRRLALLQEVAELNDGQLLELFLRTRQDAAFEAVVRRYGAMVLAVCRRVLHHEQDAEDAFQATFLVLVRKASSIAKREMLGAWLYGVAYRIAVRAKVMGTRKRRRELEAQSAFPGFSQEMPHNAVQQELEEQLDSEINCLPRKFRVPLILCELEGLSRAVVAQRLGLPEGTLSSRLARARALLRQRLAQRGMAFTSVALAALLASQAKAAAPAMLIGTTVKTAALFSGTSQVSGLLSAKVAVLVKAGLKSLLLAKLKIGALMVAGVVLMGTGVGTWAIGSGILGEHPGEALVETVLDDSDLPDALQRIARAEDSTFVEEAAQFVVNAEPVAQPPAPPTTLDEVPAKKKCPSHLTSSARRYYWLHGKPPASGWRGGRP